MNSLFNLKESDILTNCNFFINILDEKVANRNLIEATVVSVGNVSINLDEINNLRMCFYGSKEVFDWLNKKDVGEVAISYTNARGDVILSIKVLLECCGYTVNMISYKDVLPLTVEAQFKIHSVEIM